MLNRNHLVIKILLVFFAEAVAMTTVYGFSELIHPIPHPLPTHIIAGAALAVLVVWLYNRHLLKKKQRVEEELQELTEVVLKKLPEEPEKTDEKKER